MPGDSPSWPDYRPQSRRRACHSGLSILTDEVHQRRKERTSDSLRKQVGNHDLARQMLHAERVCVCTGRLETSSAGSDGHRRHRRQCPSEHCGHPGTWLEVLEVVNQWSRQLSEHRGMPPQPHLPCPWDGPQWPYIIATTVHSDLQKRT